ncbi:hypothetical protein [Bradyrhizobium sp. SZCCHNPS1003]|uniref:hypothetical protein n=1 Tax=Bradyrhizobium sp. SZCCHNPS1003 TaxID=3057330 RepID=UPI0028E34FFB|nr:hypothetical protein [Bradyrhizobium sp. SZCCHNPS1003]
MSFYLVRLEPDPNQPGVCTDVPLPEYGPYEKGSEAAKEAKRVGDYLGVRVQPRRMSQAGDWRERHRKRLADGIERGILKALPAKWDLPPISDHFAHIQLVGAPSMITFVATEEDAILDKFTSVTPGRYISRYYDTDDHKIPDDQRRKLISSIDPSGEVFFAFDPDEIVRVYADGPSSCMDGDHKFSTPVRPVSVYGAGDLAVAYTVNSRGRIQSRAVCWPKNKVYGRCYGDVQRLEAALEAEGFETPREGHSADENGPTFVGARMMKVFLNNDKNYVVMPYFDDLNICVDAGDHWITADKEPPPSAEQHPDIVKSGGTNGYAEIQRWCPKMRNYYSKRSFRQVNGVDQQWSVSGCERYAFQCSETHEYWPDEDQYKVVLPNVGRVGDCWVSKKWFDENGAICEATGKPCKKSDLVEHKGKMVSRHWLRWANERSLRDADYGLRPLRGRTFDRVWVDDPISADVSISLSRMPIPLGEITMREMIEGRFDPTPARDVEYVTTTTIDGRVIRRRVA